MLTSSTVLFLLIGLSIVHSLWTTGPTTFPATDWGASAGYYGNKIYILGGQSNQFALAEFDITSNTFTNYTSTHWSGTAVWGRSTFYKQIGNELYLLLPGNTISVYNLQTNMMISNWNNITFPINVGNEGCLAVSSNFLFIVGGTGAANTFQVLNRTTNTWITPTDPLQIGRESFACIIHPLTNRLYSFGGYAGTTESYTNSIESIYVSGTTISSETWSHALNNLIYSTVGAAVFIYGDTIWVISGSQTNSGFITTIQIFNVSNEVVSAGDTLSYGARWAPLVATNDRVYSFIGYSGSARNTWQYDIFPSSMPSAQPSAQPSSQPSEQPSNIPTTNPSANPSLFPSNIPSTNPSSNPSKTPSNYPTVYPSSLPSNNPTVSPINLHTTHVLVSTTEQEGVVDDTTTLEPHTSEDGNGENNISENDGFTVDTHHIILYVVISILFILLTIAMIIIVSCYKRNKRLKEQVNVIKFSTDSPSAITGTNIQQTTDYDLNNVNLQNNQNNVVPHYGENLMNEVDNMLAKNITNPVITVDGDIGDDEYDDLYQESNHTVGGLTAGAPDMNSH